MPKNEKIFRIAWDGDGVLINSEVPVLAQASLAISEILGRKVKIVKEDLFHHNALFDVVFNLTGDEKLAEQIRQYWFTPEIISRSLPNMAAVEVFNRCQELPNTFQSIITTRIPECRQATLTSLEKHLHNFDWQKDFHIRAEVVPGVSGDDFKVGTMENRQINLMNEDNTPTVALIQARMPICRVNYFNQPWNATDLDPSRSGLRVDPNDTETIHRRILEAREQFLSA